MSEPIDPERFYTFREATRLIPSCHAGKKLSAQTLHAWHRRGELRAELRQCGKRKFYFIQGIELLRLQAPQRLFDGVTPAEVRRQHERDLSELRRMGAI